MFQSSLLRKLLFPALLLAALTQHSAAAPQPAYQLETVVAEIDSPWSMDFLPDGRALVTQLGGELRILDGDQLSAPVAGVPEVFYAGQGGLFDVLVDPGFMDNQTIYLSYAAGNSEANATTVARAILNGAALSDVAVIYAAVPTKYAPLHYGGRMLWMDDGHLLLTTGDGFDFREKAQSTGNHFGKTIRIATAATNADSQAPFSEAPLVWSIGHRNPQGLASGADGTIYLHEHGPKGGDEVNVIVPGRNYGWPAITYGKDYNGANVSPFTAHPSMEQPIHTWTPSIAPSGLMVYQGNQFPAWRGDLFVGALVDQEVRRLDLQNGKVVAEDAPFSEISERVRDIREGPDGSIYVLTDGPQGAIYRISAGA
ncbi:MAG: PQQ-dependent sugar dehydrogenase [Pseudomonadales bacterium]